MTETWDELHERQKAERAELLESVARSSISLEEAAQKLGLPKKGGASRVSSALAYHTGLSFKAVRYKGEEFAVRKLMEDGRERTRNDIGNALGIDPEVAARIGRKLYGDGVLDMEFFDSSTPIYRMKEAS